MTTPDTPRTRRMAALGSSMGGDRSDHGGLPTFLVIGAMKAGTTSLYQYLRDHPDVFMPDVKEPRYFNPEFHFSRGIDWYRSLFRGSDQASAIGEASTTYTKHPRLSGVPARVASLLPDAKLIYVVRNPIERARSQWVHWIMEGRESLPLDRALQANPLYLAYSRYTTQIEQYLPHFQREQLLVVTSDALRDDRLNTLQGIFSFIGARDDWTPPRIDVEFHQSSRKTSRRTWAAHLRRLPGFDTWAGLSPDWLRSLHYRLTTDSIPKARMRLSDRTRSWLVEELKPEVEGLRPFLGDDFDGWGIG